MDFNIELSYDFTVYLYAYATTSTQHNENGIWTRYEDMTGNFSKCKISLKDIYEIVDFDKEDAELKRFNNDSNFNHKPLSVVKLWINNESIFNFNSDKPKNANRTHGLLVVPYKADELRYEIAKLKDKYDLFQRELDNIRNKYLK